MFKIFARKDYVKAEGVVLDYSYFLFIYFLVFFCICLSNSFIRRWWIV